MRVLKYHAGRFCSHPLGNEHDNVVTLSNKLSGLERLTIDNLARPLDELDEALVAFAMACERPDRLWHRMLEIEVVGKHRKQPVQVIAFERSVDSLDQFNIAILVHVRSLHRDHFHGSSSYSRAKAKTIAVTLIAPAMNAIMRACRPA